MNQQRDEKGDGSPADNAQREAFAKQFGHMPTDAELAAFLSDWREVISNPDVWQHLHERAISEDVDPSERYEARRAILVHRKAIRMQRPDNYVAPESFAEVQSRMAAGEAYFKGASFEGLHYSPYQNTEPPIVDLEECNFSDVKLNGVYFPPSTMAGGAVFGAAKLYGCHAYASADFERADFSRAVFHKTSFFSGVRLEDASFEDARFHYYCSIEFDRNRVRCADLQKVRSKWMALKRAFTGIEQFLNVAFCLAYFTLLLAKVYVLSTVGDIQTAVLKRQAELGLGEGAVLFEEGVSVWQMVFAGGTPTAYSLGVAVIILLYQIGRYRLTRKIGPMIEDQRTDGRTPAFRDYASLFTWHRRVQVLGFVALAVFVIDLYYALSNTVYPVNWSALTR
ncbi:pentapeptide repeat-containing protein [uncultured Tateyamaria sp.]|uniref:pentapeptide repeat-containing protein n=1 Tax=uncultured Tateyamaria sp. TaxID=455651 RepID=UPI00262289A1|nr:pentapeptide repeat-containing protein [uncultured Tateyamaria sp.]